MFLLQQSGALRGLGCLTYEPDSRDATQEGRTKSV